MRRHWWRVAARRFWAFRGAEGEWRRRGVAGLDLELDVDVDAAEEKPEKREEDATKKQEDEKGVMDIAN